MSQGDDDDSWGDDESLGSLLRDTSGSLEVIREDRVSQVLPNHGQDQGEERCGEGEHDEGILGVERLLHDGRLVRVPSVDSFCLGNAAK